MLSSVFQLSVYFMVHIFLFWSVQISGALYYVDFLNFTKPRADQIKWAQMMVQFFRVRFFYADQGRLYRDGPCVYLCNHRSWADFFVEHYLTGGRCAALSRLLVLLVLPVFMTYGYFSQSMFFFRRDRVKDKEQFNAWLDKCMKESPFKGLIVYPEGHRNTTEVSLPLKKGMLKYAYLRQIPCQIIISKNKGEPFSEKNFRVRFGCKVYTAFSKCIRPKDFEEFEDFFKEIQSEWNLKWTAAFSVKDPTGLERIDRREHETFDYPLAMRLKLALSMMTGMLLFLCVIYGMGYFLISLYNALCKETSVIST